MKNTDLEISTAEMDLEEKAIIKKASEAFKRNDFQGACNDLLSVYKQDNNPRGLQVSIAQCLIKLNKCRQGILFAFKELLDYPDSRMANHLVSQETIKVNGRILRHTFHETERPEKYPDISLVLIVKNEEKDLARCLQSFKDIVKEIIIVDTGSTDRTVEIAKSFNARVEYFEWCDDFAEARNESLKYATCEWILRTDADEYIEDSEKAKLLHCVNSGLAEAYICPTISTTEKGEDVVENVRLIKNHLGITYNYPIHETIINSVIRNRLTQCLANINFKHTGYENNEPDALVKKIKRNVEVCEKFLKKHPDDYYVRLIRDLFILDGEQNEIVLNDIEEIIKNLPDSALSVKYLGLAFLHLSQRYIKQKRDIELLDILQDIQISFNTTNSIMQYAGEVYLYARGDWKKASKIFSWISKRGTESLVFSDSLTIDKYNPKANLLLLAETNVLNKEYEKARKNYLLAKKSEDVEIEKMFSAELKETQDKMETLTAAGLREFSKLLREKYQWLNAYRAIIRAASKSELTFKDYIDMAVCQVQINNFNFAKLLLNEAKLIQPSSDIIMNLESFIAMNENDIDKAFEKALEAFIYDPGNTNYQSNVEKIAQLRGLSPVDAIKKSGLEWLKKGRTKDGLFALTIYLKFQPDDQDVHKVLAKYL